MRAEFKEIEVVVGVMMEEVMVKLGVMVTEPWPVLNPLLVAVDGKEPPPPDATLPPPAPPE